MKKLMLLIVIVLTLVSIFPHTEGAQGTRVFDVSSLTIKFDKTDAEFTLRYDIGTFPRLYILLMGGTSIEPNINDLFSKFDYEILKLDHEKAILRVRNISRFEKGYYLHDSTSFGTKIKNVIVYIPGEARPSEYFGLNATKNTFYQ